MAEKTTVEKALKIAAPVFKAFIESVDEYGEFEPIIADGTYDTIMETVILNLMRRHGFHFNKDEFADFMEKLHEQHGA